MRRSLDYLLEKKQQDFYNSLNNINTISLAKIIEVDNSNLEASIELIAKTEFKLIPESAEYNALMED